MPSLLSVMPCNQVSNLYPVEARLKLNDLNNWVAISFRFRSMRRFYNVHASLEVNLRTYSYFPQANPRISPFELNFPGASAATFYNPPPPFIILRVIMVDP